VAIHESFPSKAEHSVAPRYHCGVIMGKMEATEEERLEFEVDEFGPVYIEIKKM